MLGIMLLDELVNIMVLQSPKMLDELEYVAANALYVFVVLLNIRLQVMQAPSEWLVCSEMSGCGFPAQLGRGSSRYPHSPPSLTPVTMNVAS
jgi:hypothetical protein